MTQIHKCPTAYSSLAVADITIPFWTSTGSFWWENTHNDTKSSKGCKFLSVLPTEQTKQHFGKGASPSLELEPGWSFQVQQSVTVLVGIVSDLMLLVTDMGSRTLCYPFKQHFTKFSVSRMTCAISYLHLWMSQMLWDPASLARSPLSILHCIFVQPYAWFDT